MTKEGLRAARGLVPETNPLFVSNGKIGQMKVALVYDRVNKWGGAERVLLCLHDLFPSAPLYTSVFDSGKAGWAGVFPEVIPSFLQGLPFARNRHEYFPYLMPLAFESFSFADYDLVISVTSEFAKGIITSPSTKHLCYCLTPTRYLWSGYEDYFRNPVLKNLSLPLVNYLRNWDKMAAQRPDLMVSISSAVQKRIKDYYDRDSQVVFPPVPDLTRVKAVKVKKNNLGSDFFLVVSRLVPYKKVDLVIRAFNQLGLPLIIAGAGSEERRLRLLAKKNITFAGELTDRELVNYYGNCRGLIFPQEEDFGLVAVEAQQFGKPVIAFKAGGALETVRESQTGVFFKQQRVEDLTAGVERFQKMRFNERTIKNHAKQFSETRFKQEFLELIKNV